VHSHKGMLSAGRPTGARPLLLHVRANEWSGSSAGGLRLGDSDGSLTAPPGGSDFPYPDQISSTTALDTK
jgi:hypothetical protein